MTTKLRDLWDGEVYNANAILQYALDQTVIESYLSFEGGEKVLDVGCGDGAITALLAAFVPNGDVVGVDSSSSMIDFAMKAYAPLYPNISFHHQYSVEKLPYKETFTSFCSLHLVANMTLSLQNIYDALKFEGKTLLFFPILEESPWYQEMVRLIAQTSWGSSQLGSAALPVAPDISLNAVSVRNLCAEVGFTTTDVTIQPFSYTFPTHSHYQAWCKAMCSMLLVSPSDGREEQELDEIIGKLESFLQKSGGEAEGKTGIAMEEVTLVQTFVIAQALKHHSVVDPYFC